MVVEYFSPMDVERENAIYYTTLATFLSKNSGYKVTVLIAGPLSTNYEQLRKLYLNKRIELARLPEIGLYFESSRAAETSYRIMRYIVEESHARGGPWEMILMFGARGFGYYTLLAQRQGLLCIGSHMIVGLDALTSLRREQLRKGSKTALVTDEESLAADYMQQRATEMADTVITASKALLDYCIEQGWRIPEHVYIMPHLTIPVANEKSEIERADELIPARQTQVKEFVYIGALGLVGGLGVFLNALDNILSRDQKAHRKLLKDRQLKVTFYGWNDVANDEGDLTGEHYIEMRSYSWGSRIKWNVNAELHLKKMIKYLTEPGKGRVAVIPAVGDSSAFFLHQALRAGVPIIASNLKSAQEIVHIQDRRDLLFAANDTVALSKRMLDVFNNGGRPQLAIRQYEAQWRQLLGDVHARPLPSCPTEGFTLPLNNDEDGNASPLVTVVVTHHNRHKLLQQALESLERQTYKNFEVVLVDDGSTETEAIKYLSELSWKWWQERAWKVLREPNRYLGAARNTGAKHARGKYILFMDDDDIAKPDQIATMARIAELTGADVVTTGHDLFRGRNYPKPNSATARYVPLGSAINAGVLKNVFGDSNMLVHRQFFLDMGGFTEEYGVGFEDYEFLAKVVTRDNHLEASVEPLHWYRQHPGTMSLYTDLKAGQVRFLRAYLDVFAYLPKMTQGLLRYAQVAFFELDRGPMLKYALSNTTTITTTTTDTTTATTRPTSTTETTSTMDETVTATISTVLATTTTLPTTSSLTSTFFTTQSTTTTSTVSRATYFTTLQTPGGTCPCRSHKRQKLVTSISSTRSTCFSTATVQQTIRRTLRATTLTITYTPTVSCDPIHSKLVPLPKMLVDGQELFGMGSNDYNQETSVVTKHMFGDAPPARAPLAVSAEYAPGGEFVAVQFDRPVNVEVGRRFRCNTFLVMKARDVPNAALLGNNPEDCLLYFASQTEMRIQVDSRYTRREKNALQPGRLIVFRDGTLSNVDTLNRAFVSGAIEVAPPFDADPPTIIVNAPVVIGACDEYVRIDFSRSVGAAGRPFIDAHFDFNSTAVENHFLDSPLRQFLHSTAIDVIKTGRMVFDIPASLLTEFTAYTFQLTLWNVFGVGGTGYATVSRVTNTNVPAVYLEGPTKGRQDEVLQFTGLLPGLVCGKSYDAVLAWSILSGPMRVKIRGANRPTVVFTPNTLQPGDYVLGLRVAISIQEDGPNIPNAPLKINHNPATGSTYLYTVAFSVLPTESRIEIIGGSRLIGYEDWTRLVVRIIGRSSLDDYVFSWRCLSVDRESPCVKQSGEEWDPPTVTNFIVNGRDWERATDMEFFVTAKHQLYGHQLHDSVVIAISRNASVPRVEIATERNMVTTHEKTLRLMSAVSRPRDPSQPRNYTFQWESLAYCNRQAYAVAPAFGRGLTDSIWTDVSTDLMEVTPASLIPGTEYCFRAAVIDGITNVIGWAFRIVKVREPPTAGYCELTSSAVGKAFQNRFTVACHGWSGPNLRYRFKVRIRGDPIPLGPASPSSQLSFMADVGHYLLEVDILDGEGLITTVPVRNISASHGDTSKDLFLSQQINRFERSHNPRLGYEILSLVAVNLVPNVLAGQTLSKMMATRRAGADSNLNTPESSLSSLKTGNVTLTRILQIVDSLSQSTNIDAEESGPYFLDYLQRILPAKLPIDLRPLLLRIISRIVQGMSRDRGPDRCFAQHHMIKILRLLEPIYENPRGGSPASFVVHEIKNAMETCVQRTMYCNLSKGSPLRQDTISRNGEDGAMPDGGVIATGVRKSRNVKRFTLLDATAGKEQMEEPILTFTFDDQLTQTSSDLVDDWDGEPFTWVGDKQMIEFGLVDTRNVTLVSRLCGFNLPDLRGMASESQPCLGYRCSLTRTNLMRNSSIDTTVVELAFRNASQVLAPWFRTRHLTFLLPLSNDFQRRLGRGGKPKCVWYDRYLNATSSTWSDEGCQVLGFNMTHVQCTCTHLTEFSIMMVEPRRPIRLPVQLIILCAFLILMIAYSSYKVWWSGRNRDWREWWLGLGLFNLGGLRMGRGGGGGIGRDVRRQSGSTLVQSGSSTFSHSTLVAASQSTTSSSSTMVVKLLVAPPRPRRYTTQNFSTFREVDGQLPFNHGLHRNENIPNDLRRTRSQIFSPKDEDDKTLL